jgi:choline-sulfatase
MAALCVAAPVVLAAQEKPNILFLFADDPCFQTIHRLGGREVITPNLDRLVKAGTSFTHTYNLGS